MTTQRDGFSLVELIIALVILSFGILAMGASTGYVLKQIRAAELRNERMIAVHQAVETVRGVAWTALPTACQSDYAIGDYAVSCSVSYPPISQNLARVQFVSVGPGYVRGTFALNSADTLSISISEPQ